MIVYLSWYIIHTTYDLDLDYGRNYELKVNLTKSISSSIAPWRSIGTRIEFKQILNLFCNFRIQEVIYEKTH